MEWRRTVLHANILSALDGLLFLRCNEVFEFLSEKR